MAVAPQTPANPLKWDHHEIRNKGTRQDTWGVVVTYAGNNMGYWDKKTGGELDSDELKYYAGGMKAPVSLGGRKNVGNVVLTRLYDLVDDHDQINALLLGVGRARVGVSQRPYDFETEMGYGKRIMYAGTLKRVTVPEVDSESTTAALIEIEITIEGYPSAQ